MSYSKRGRGVEEEKDDAEETGKKIGRIIGVAKLEVIMSVITDADLDRFEAYLSHQQAIGPIMKPEFFTINDGFAKIERAARRARVVREIIRLVREEM